jgi:hypothetical protein
MIYVHELQGILENMDPEALVILSRDAEGNGYSNLAKCEQAPSDGDGWPGEDGPLALFLYPLR